MQNYNNFKIALIAVLSTLLSLSCNTKTDKEKIKKEILKTEKAFEKMAAEKSISAAFYFYADENAVIKRENDTLIKGKENIRNYYKKSDRIKAKVSWTPDFIEVSDCGTLAYTYGKYLWQVENHLGETVSYKGVFHTIWKKQKDNTWKYVWD